MPEQRKPSKSTDARRARKYGKGKTRNRTKAPKPSGLICRDVGCKPIQFAPYSSANVSASGHQFRD